MKSTFSPLEIPPYYHAGVEIEFQPAGRRRRSQPRPARWARRRRRQAARSRCHRPANLTTGAATLWARWGGRRFAALWTASLCPGLPKHRRTVRQYAAGPSRAGLASLRSARLWARSARAVTDQPTLAGTPRLRLSPVPCAAYRASRPAARRAPPRCGLASGRRARPVHRFPPSRRWT